MKAIDLYSGIGGWSMGLKMAGIEVVASFELWPAANATYKANFGRAPHEVDIRTLDVTRYFKPGEIDVVVGSPPCTQFSFANRGGAGDIAEGLLDIKAFLTVVEALEPRYWVMENVPRVAAILDRETRAAGSLYSYRSLLPEIIVVDASDFGVPQVRRRMLAGSFNSALLTAYTGHLKHATLGTIISALTNDPVEDPNYEVCLSRSQLTDHLIEEPLSCEETRRNKEAKAFHPVYNAMSFPDQLHRASRTVTAICTRVSRESIIVPSVAGGYRRLTVRERSCLQTFPIQFRLGGKSYTDRVRMIGNAMPPMLGYCVARAIQDVPVEMLLRPDPPVLHNGRLRSPKLAAPRTGLAKLNAKRRFRSAVPGFRFGSGIRFELLNEFEGAHVAWNVSFVYGTPKKIRTVSTRSSFLEPELPHIEGLDWTSVVSECFEEIHNFLRKTPLCLLQDRWTRRSNGPGPYDLIDILGVAGDRVLERISAYNHQAFVDAARRIVPDLNTRLTETELVVVFAGLVMMSAFSRASLEKQQEAPVAINSVESALVCVCESTLGEDDSEMLINTA